MPAENSDQESMLSYQVAKMMRIYLLPEPFFSPSSHSRHLIWATIRAVV